MRLLAVVLLVPMLSGCAIWDDLTRPDIAVSRTDLDDRNDAGFVTTRTFVVSVNEPGGEEVVITARASDGRQLRAQGISTAQEPLELELEDGTWDVSYSVAGHKWETFKRVKVDATPPSTAGLPAFVQAQDGAITLGQGYTPEADTRVEVRDADGGLLADGLPLEVDGLGDGIHFFVIVLTDAALNQVTHTVQVASGDAARLPDGQLTFGIVARYTNQARIWDLRDMAGYASPAQARAATDGRWLGSEPVAGQDTDYGITPDDPAVQGVVDEVLDGTESTAQAAWELYRWMLDNLEYDEQRLDSNTLMLPRQVILDSEDPDAEADASQDGGGDGLADDGNGNGVPGGVCRDLAATYVSLLRAAGIPARLVSGYLAGNVDGFHAWVEVYVGPRFGQAAWLPVDVSGIDGAWEEGGDVPHGLQQALTSFGIQLPPYLALRKIPDHAELPGWSTALSTEYQYTGVAPSVEFVKDVQDVGEPQHGLLCFSPETLERRLATRTSECSGMYVVGRDASDPDFAHREPFVVATQRIIDYGMRVSSAAGGTTITMRISYPFPEDVEPDRVERVIYVDELPDGWSIHQDPPDALTGTVTATLRR